MSISIHLARLRRIVRVCLAGRALAVFKPGRDGIGLHCHQAWLAPWLLSLAVMAQAQDASSVPPAPISTPSGGVSFAVAASMPVGAQQLPGTIVTASRLSMPLTQAIAAVSVISRTDIERSQALSLQALLNQQSGIDFYNYGGQGKETGIYLRGSNSNHVKVLVDGVPVNAPDSGLSGVQYLPPELIDHIEIVRGPFSSLYGSDAIGGVIQIFTRHEREHVEAGLGLGSFNTRSAYALLAQPFGQAAWYNLSFQRRRTDGFPSCVPDTKAGCYVSKVRDSGDDNLSLNLRVGQDLEQGAAVEAHLLHTRDDTHYNGNYSDASLVERTQAGLRWQGEKHERWQTSWQLDSIWQSSDNTLAGAPVNIFQWRNDKASWQNDWQLDATQHLSAGLDWQRETADDTAAYRDVQRASTGAFAQYLLDVGAEHWQLGARHDYSAQYGGVNTGSLTWGHDLAPGLRASLSYGTAFHAPGFLYLYYPNYSNPNLLPERSRTVDVGLTGTPSRHEVSTAATDAPDWRWSWHVYDTRIEDLIVSTSSTKFIPYNLGEARILGSEWEGTLTQGAWSWRGNLALLNPRDRTPGSNDGRLLPNRAQRLLTLAVDMALAADTSTGLTLHAQGSRMDYTAGTHRLPGYATVDWRLSRKLTPQLLVQASVQNLFDRYYQTVYQYNTPGRGLYLTLRYQPKE